MEDVVGYTQFSEEFEVDYEFYKVKKVYAGKHHGAGENMTEVAKKMHQEGCLCK